MRNVTTKKRWGSSSFWSFTEMLPLSSWRGENVKKSARDRENVQNVTDEKEVAISDYRLLNCSTFSF